MDDLKTHWRKVSIEQYYPIALAHECIIVLIHLCILVMSVYAPNGVYTSNVIISGIALFVYWYSVTSRFQNINRTSVIGKGETSSLRKAYTLRGLAFMVNVSLFVYNVVTYA